MVPFVYVDNSNVWIEGYEAVCPSTAQIGRSSLFGSRPPANDSLWSLAESAGFEVTVFDRHLSNKEKQVDSAITTQILDDSFQYMRPERGDRAVLLAGDRDYLPPIESLANRGLPTTVVFWTHATARDLRDHAEPAARQLSLRLRWWITARTSVLRTR